MRESTHDPDRSDAPAGESARPDGASLEFDGADPLMPSGRRHVPLAARAALAATPVLLALIVVLAQTGPFFGGRRQGGVEVTVVCEVPWMALRLDDDGKEITCHQPAAALLPTTSLVVTPGNHVLSVAADGYAAQRVPFTASPGSAPFLVARPQLTVDGALRILDAVNTYLAHTGYIEHVALPATLWSDLNLSQPPKSRSLTVEERFEAIAVDPLLPTFEQTNYLRPIPPDRGAVGAAVAVVEHVAISDGCSSRLLLRRETPIVSRARAGVVFSVAHGEKTWSASHPYALNPAANIYSDRPVLTSLPAAPPSLYALAARTQLAAMLGDAGALAAAVADAPVAGQTAWGSGVLFSDQDTGDSPSNKPRATWLYLGGLLFNLTDGATGLTPLAQPASPELRRWMAATGAAHARPLAGC
jgi:hypothetical protein